MHKFFILFLTIFIFSCSKRVTSPSETINFYTKDQEFIDNLVSINEQTDEDDIINRISTVYVDGDDSNYYRIEKINLNSMGLDSMSIHLSNLDSLKFLYCNDNNIEYLPDDFCTFSEDLDSLDITSNLLCNPQVPTCIIDLELTTAAFYDTQTDCEYQMSEPDQYFIKMLIDKNWDIKEGEVGYDSLWTLLNNEERTVWEEFLEEDELTGNTVLVSRIVKIVYTDFFRTDEWIQQIPPEIQYVDSLQILELSNNALMSIPPEIGYLPILRVLDISHNEINAIPESYGGAPSPGLRKLESFIISDNSIDEISSSLSNLSSLEFLNLSRNSLENLPVSLCGDNMSNDLIIQIIGNDFGCDCATSGYNSETSCFKDIAIDQTCDCE